MEHGKDPIMEWSQEIPGLFENIKHHEKLLFDDMDPFIEEVTLCVAGPAVTPASDRKG
jgi:hypothetical protein